MPNYKNITGDPLYNEFPKTQAERQHLWGDLIKLDIEKNAISGLDDPRTSPMSAWTFHTTVYNIKDRTMQIVIVEEYDKIIPSATTSFKVDAGE